MHIYLLRHGETDSNALAIHQTHASELSSIGVKQAESAATRLLSIPIDHIIASDYSRTRQTVHIIAEKLGLDCEFDPLLREIKRPTEFEGKELSDTTIQAAKQEIIEHMLVPDWHYADEENLFDVKLRCLKMLEKLREIDKTHVLIVSHGITIRMLVSCMVFPDQQVVPNFEYILEGFKMTNTGITVCERNEEKKFRVLTWNDYTHLP